MKKFNLSHQSGIYKITNLTNNISYIGQAKDIYERYYNHHVYDYLRLDFDLYKAMQEDGIENFIIEVIELCSEEQLDTQEIYWIEYYDTYNNGYNMTKGGQFWSPKVHSQETEAKRAVTREVNKSLMDENHPRAKLTNNQVLDIRERYKNGESAKSIYQDFKELYSFDTFQQIILGTHYKRVGNIPTQKEKKLANSRFTEQDILDIRKGYLEENKTQQELANSYNVSQSTIKDIVNYISYKEITDNFENKRKRKTYRLTADEVREIRRLFYEDNWTVQEIAKQYQIDWSAIKKCVTYQTYKNIE